MANNRIASSLRLYDPSQIGFIGGARLTTEDQYAYVRLAKQVLRTDNVDALREVVRQIRAGEIEDLSQMNYADLVDVQELKIEDAEPRRLELESFPTSVRDGTAVEIPAIDGLRAVELAERIVAAMPQRSV